MPSAKIAITIDRDLLSEVDRWVATGEFPNRSRAIQAALLLKREERQRRGRLLSELAKLDPKSEQEMADEFLVGESQWPEY